MLKSMDYVYAVYVNKSFSKAAEALYISQPALSAAIKKVEIEVGTPLFDRRTNPISLTEAGKYYIESVERVMQIEEDMKLKFKALSELNKSTINVGAASFFCTYVLPDLIKDFQDKHPQYTVNVLEANADDLMKYLKSGVVDLIIDVETRGEHYHYESVIWAEDDILLVVPKAYKVNATLIDSQLTYDTVRSGDYHNDDYLKVDLYTFKDERFLLLKEGNDMYNRSMRMFKNAEYTPKVSMYLDQMLTSFRIACKGIGATFVRAGLTNYLEPTDDVYFYKLNDDNSKQNIKLYYKKEVSPSEIRQDFIDYLLQHTPKTV
ncbi:MAG TPA: LysR family transcriptional regulator [Aliicoccus persicus]|uniref:LysR family transcriptional regulator n=1 Tax=Aliicoccus persicus TaxID=930138 RepID=A0A921B4P5_9STAP|nr:LysR family transcriptional regulator [Aliicoccus persicus]